MRLLRQSPAFVVALLALVVALGGAAFAAIPAADGDVHFCYSKKTGAVEVVNTQIDRFGCERNWRGFIIDSRPAAIESAGGASSVEATQGGINATTEGNLGLTAQDNASLTAGKDMSVTAGKNLAVETGKVITVDAGDKIVLKTGDASIEMRKDGTISIKGKGITIDGQKVDVKASSDVTIKGSKVGGN
jgi:hypothetical protein